MPTGPNRQSTIQRIVLRVDEVDIPNRQIHGYDKTNVLVIATFRETPAGVLHIPSQNERWVAERQGQGHWRLVGRLDSADDQTVLQNLMQPGDVRIGDIEPDPNDTSRFNGSGTVFSPTLQAYLFATPYDTYSVKNGDIEVGSGHGAIQTTDGSAITSITLTNRPATWGCYVFMRNITGQPILFEQSNVGPSNFEKSLRASFTLANRAWVVLFLDGWGAQWCPIAMGTEAGIADALPGDGTRNLDGLGHWTVPSVSSQAILSLGPSLYWRLDEKLGTIAHDSSGNSRNGTYDTGMTLGHPGGLIGDPATSVYSPPSSAGNNDAHGEVVSSYQPFQGGSRTFLGWSYVTDLNVSGGPVMFGGDPMGQQFLWVVQGTTDVRWSPNSILTWTAAWPGVNQWVHWAVTHDPTTGIAELFINGVSKGTRTSTTGWPAYSVNDHFDLGELDGLPGYFEDVAVYESVLTAAEIGMIYGAGLGPGGYLTSSSGVTSFNTRTGAVVSTTGDYSLTQINAGTQHRLVISGASTLGDFSAGSSGQLLQSAGSSADPAWTTATYPSSTSVAGHVPRSNGTNYVDAALAASDLSNGTTGSGAVVLAGSPALTGAPTAPTPAETDDSTTIATTAFVHDVMPEGVIVPYGGASAPTGWLLCNGAAVSRTTYAALFAVISTTYGAGDGSTTFNVPNMQGNVPVGKDSGTFATLGGTGGAQTTTDFVIHTHTFTGSAMGTHSHADTASFSGSAMGTHSHASTASFSGTSDTTGNNSASHTHTGPSHSHDIATSSPEVKYGAAYTTSGSSLGIGDIGGHTGSIETLNFSNTGTAAGTGATGTQSSDHTHTVTPTGTVSITPHADSAGTPAGTVTVTPHADSAGTPAGTNANAGTVTAVSLLQPYLVTNFIIKY